MILVLLAGCTLFGFQNCSGFRTIISGSDSAASLGELQPTTDRLDENCQNSSEYDACVFKKSTVSQNRAAVSSDGLSVSSLTDLQKYGVKLSGLDGSGKLRNSSIDIVTLLGKPYLVNSGKVQFDSSGKDTSLEQLMAYYWMNRAIEYLSFRSDDVAVKDQSVKVIVDDKISGWNSKDKTIHLYRSEDKVPMAFDGGTLVYFLAQANVDFASGGKAFQLVGEKHRTCGGREGGCCQSEKGCARAIASGAADYLVGVMFPEDPMLGETWLNRTAGAGFCGQSRSLEENDSLTATAAFSACEAKDGSGEIHTLGSVYASIWWKIRKSAEDPKEVDQLYFRHLKKIKASDDFSTALNNIKDVDQEMFAGKYSEKFTDEFSARGL